MEQQAIEALEELITIGDFIRWGASRFSEAELFYGHGTDNAWDEAVAIILPTLHLPHTINPAVMTARLTASERQAIVNLLLKRMTERLPAAYLTHQAWFAGLKFYVDQRVIIPRSSLAELIEHRFAPWLGDKEPQRILDLCTGSACIAIACAHYFPETAVDAVDISEEALLVAQTNVAHYQLAEQVRLIQSDLFQKVGQVKYDIIISNPPYVDSSDMESLPPEYQYEPALALAAGADGLTIVKRILREAAQYLTADGLLFVEVGNSEAALIEQYPEIPFTWLEFAKGDNGIFMLTAQQLLEYSSQFD